MATAGDGELPPARSERASGAALRPFRVGTGAAAQPPRRPSVDRGRTRRRLERGVVAEDRLLEPLQCLARFDAEVIDERPPRLGVGLERLRLPAGAVESEHLLRAEPLPQRMLANEDAQLSKRLLVPAEREIAVDPVHQCRQPQLVELRHLVASARLEL